MTRKIASDSTTPPVRILAISGMHRSGSTLLTALLGGCEGVFAAGQLRTFWKRGLARNDLCGCGVRLRDCPVWTEAEQYAGGWPNRNKARAVARAGERAMSPGSLLSDRRRRFNNTWTAAHGTLLRAIIDSTGAQLIVDASLHPRYFAALGTIRGVDLRIVHLVRDSRAVAFSWTRHKPIPGVRSSPANGTRKGGAELPKLPAASAAAWWLSSNLLTEVVAWTGRPTLRVRYEDLVAEPRPTIRNVLHFAGLPPDRLPDGESHRFTPGVQHTVHGNPVRFHGGEIVVRPDMEWRDALPASARRRVTALTWPLLLRYGYSLRT